jgi:hypothetical protein
MYCFCGCVWLLRCRCFLATLPHPSGCPAAAFQHASYALFDEVCCCVCVQLRIFSCSYCVLIMVL